MIPGRRPKYRNKKTVVDGVKYDSAKESRRGQELKALAAAGSISNLILQPRYSLIVKGIRVCSYVGDFSYLDETGTLVVEDVKGKFTRTLSEYRIKRKLMLALHGIIIREV